MAYPSVSTIDIHRSGAWQPAATVQALGPDRCRFEYLPDYVFGHPDPWPVAMGVPLGFEPDRFVEGPTGREADRRPPSFLYDLVPQAGQLLALAAMAPIRVAGRDGVPRG